MSKPKRTPKVKPVKPVRLSINVCPTHGTRSVSVDDASGGIRLTPVKCCGSWASVISWPIDARSVADDILRIGGLK